MPEALGQPDDAGSGRRLQVLASQRLAVLVFRLNPAGEQFVVGQLDIRCRVAMTVNHAFAHCIQQFLEISRQRLDQHEAFLTDQRHGIACVQVPAIPGLRCGDPRLKDLRVIGTGFFKVFDQYVDVAELQIHEIAPVRQCRWAGRNRRSVSRNKLS
ncbi:hypothetical protein D3C81_1338600 [compost metagenome]